MPDSSGLSVLVFSMAISVSGLFGAGAVEGEGSANRTYPNGSGYEQKFQGNPGMEILGPIQDPGPPIEGMAMPSAITVLRKGTAASNAAAIAIDVKPASTTVDLYRPLFATMTMSVAYTNPFDQTDVQVDLVAVSPSGKTIVQPCFWKSGTSASSIWEARWTPREVGAFKYKITVVKNGEASTSPEQSLMVKPSNLRQGAPQKSRSVLRFQRERRIYRKLHHQCYQCAGRARGRLIIGLCLQATGY